MKLWQAILTANAAGQFADLHRSTAGFFPKLLVASGITLLLIVMWCIWAALFEKEPRP